MASPQPTLPRRCYYVSGPANGWVADLPRWADEVAVPLEADGHTVTPEGHIRASVAYSNSKVAVYERVGDLLVFRGVNPETR